IKRCVGIAGDTLEIKDGVLYVNHEKAFVSPTQSTYYYVEMKNAIDDEALREAGIQLNQDDESPDFQAMQGYTYKINLSEKELDIVRKMPSYKADLKEINSNIGEAYPQDTSLFHWTIDNFGPMWVPKKGVTIPLTPQNLALYKRLIQVYENNEWEESGGKI